MGPLRLTADKGGLAESRFAGAAARPTSGSSRNPVLAAARKWLDAYFAGRALPALPPLAPAGTAFQKRVWAELRKIPYGETRTYGEVAWRVGRPGGARAVGQANGANPLPIIVPCHRVVASGGRLGGYGGGLGPKIWLLAHEGSEPGTRRPSRKRR